jgi:hypothetical protein
MAWIVAVAFAAIVMLLVALYRRSLNAATNVNALLILVLTSDEVVSCRGCDHWVKPDPAQLARRFADTRLARAPGLL